MCIVSELKHIKEFEFYYDLGSDRSYSKVAEHFKKSITTVKKWGSSENWGDEVSLRNKQQLEENRRQSLLNRRKTVNQYQNILNSSLNTYIDKLKNKEIEVKTVKDLDRLIRLSILLDGYVYEAETALYNELKEEIENKNSKEQQEIKITFDILGGAE